MEISILPFNTRNQTNFKGAELNKRATQELETVVKPFLAKYKRPQDETLLDEIRKKSEKLRARKIKPAYQPNEFKEATRLHLGELDANLNEFKYLSGKSKQWFAGNDAKALADSIRKSGLFEAPDFLAAPLDFYKKLKLDIKNGLTNMTFAKLAPQQYNNRNSLCIAEGKLELISIWYDRVQGQAERLQIQLENNTLTEYFFAEKMAKIRNAIDIHKKLLPDIEKATIEAETINKQVCVTPEDENILTNLHKPAQRVISRNVSKFNKKVQDIKLSNEQENSLNELFNKQKSAIENLWNTIEKGKKATFAPRKQDPPQYSYFDDDMPF